MIINTKSYPRAAMIGNPSDGYFGKTIAFVFSNFETEVILYETPELEILPQERDQHVFKDIESLYKDVQLYGYYGGIRLLKATIKKFYEYCQASRIVLDKRNFTIRYRSNIPNRLGLAGSSGIITACIKALMKFYNIQIPKPLLANIVLSVETEELGLGAGLQDRVAQAFEEPVFMDFNQKIMDKLGFGIYEPFNLDHCSTIYIAYRPALSEGSEIVHNDLRARFDQGDEMVHKAMKRFAEITQLARRSIENSDWDQLNKLMNENFDLRHSICQISKANLEMIKLARSVGASAKFTGSGGAIIGLYKDEAMFDNLSEQLNKHQIEVIKPKIVS